MNQCEKTFSASWDGAVWRLSVVVCLFNIALAILFILIAFTDAFGDNSEVKIPMAGAAGLIIIVSIIPYVLAPQKYLVTEKAVIIKRIGPDIVIPLADVCSVNRMPYGEVFRRAVRTMGNGGLFGIYGNFKSASMGKFRAYMTRRNKLVVIATNEKPFVLTPDDAQGFVAAIDEMLKGRPS